MKTSAIWKMPYSRSCKWIHINTGMVIILDGYDDGDGKH